MCVGAGHARDSPQHRAHGALLHMNEPRLRWLLRRGMKELDVLVTRYHDNRYASATVDEQAAFLKLLNEVEDPDIWAWVMGHAEPPCEFASLIHEFRRHT